MSEGPKGPGLGVAAFVLGLLGVVATFLPMDLYGMRPYVAWAFGLPAFVVAVLGLVGDRKGKAFAVAGVLLSLLAVLIGMIAIWNLIGLL
jgi:branched-subunit amino acid ABC-type transport system permease component